MKRALATLAVVAMLITSGCMGILGPDDSPTPDVPNGTETTVPGTANDQMTTTDATQTPDSTTTGETTPDAADQTGAKSFQTGNQSASLATALDGETFVLYYGEHDERAKVALADVAVPSMNASENDPQMFGYHEATSEDDATAHRNSLRAIGFEATKLATSELSGPGGDEITVVHTGETNAEGVPLVYIYFDWDGRWTLYNQHVAGFGMGVLTNPDSPHAGKITAAQEWAQDNDEGLWANNEADEHGSE
jgi:endonuclease YncB( thermonuclease family)